MIFQQSEQGDMIAHGSKTLLKLITTIFEVIAKESNQPKDITKYIRCTTDLETVGLF
jgi:hypothetical protein